MLLLALIIPQMTARKDFDVDIVYCGPISPTAEQASAMQKEFAKYLPKGEPGEDPSTVGVSTIYLLSEAQMDDRLEKGLSVSAELMRSNRESLKAELVSGDALICLLDPAQYAEYRRQGAFAKWEDTLGQPPAGAVDEYAVLLKDTDFARYAGDAFAALPDDTLFCMRTYPVMNALWDGEEARARYELHRTLFCRILQFTVS